MPPLSTCGARLGAARFALLVGVSLAALAAPAAADGPKGGVVARGKATIDHGAERTTIHQRSKRAIVDWQAFDVDRGHTVEFDQPGRDAATLNRVRSGGRSVIAGAIEAPGTVIVQNDAGVVFTRDATIDVGGLVATSHDVDADRFAADGRLDLRRSGAPGARVVNRGAITVGEAGLVALVGGDVANDGAIVARGGTVALATGARATIDFTGDGVARFAVEGDGGGGIDASGLIEVGDGRVVISAGDAARALDAVINTDGVIRATGAAGGGTIRIEGRGAGKVRLGGRIEAKGGRKGGSVTATGAEIEVARGAWIDASGGIAGGSVRLGGGKAGEGPLRRADALTMAAGARVAVDGGLRGGEAVLWSDGATRADGRITATGADTGGFVETSGRVALAVGPDAAVEVGVGGTWLLDPRDVVIGNAGLSPVPPGVTNPPAGSTPFTIDRNAIASALNAGGDVTITTAQTGSSMPGDITVSGPIVWNGAGDLTLIADRDVRIDSNVTVGDGDFTARGGRDVTVNGVISAPRLGGASFDATRDVTINQNVRATGSGAVALRARTGDVIVTAASAGNVQVTTDTGALTLQADRSEILLRRVNPQSGSNVQVFSNSGDVTLTAGDRILLEGGTQGGRWVRVGQTGSSSDVTLTASKIKVWGGGVGNTFAEVVSGAGGSITMRADEIFVRNGAGDEGRIQALNGSSLTLLSEIQTWNGPVRSGNGARNGGETTISGRITAGFQPQFSLAPGRNFTLLAQSPKGVQSRYVSGQNFAVTTSGTGAIDLRGPVSAAEITLESEERVALGRAAQITASGAGDALTVAAGRNFRNESTAGADALRTTTAGARWLLYIDTFAGLEGPAPAPRGFDLYGRLYPDNPPPTIEYAGNRIVYGERPTLTVTGETLSKTYGTAVTPGLTVTGLRAGDTLDTALDSGPSAASAGSAADASVRATPYAVDVLAVASGQGYRLNLVPGALTVTPAALTITADGATRGYGAANPRFTARAEGFVLGQDLGDLDGWLGFTTPATQASDVGAYHITPGGVTSGDYAITFVDGTLDVTPAALTIRANDATRTYGAANPRLTASGEGFVLGQGLDDLDGALTLTTPATQASDVGAYRIRAGGVTSGNYAITFADGALDVTRAALTIRADDLTRTYGAANPTLTATADGFVLGQGLDDLDGALALATTATQGSDVGSYAITAGGVTSGNYAIAFESGALAVTPAALTIRADDATRTYGAANPRLTATAEGFVLGQGLDDLDGALRVRTGATAASDVGAYAITAGGVSSGNYAITFESGALAVTPAALTIRADDATRGYGVANPRFTATGGGFVLGQGIDDLDGTLRVTTPATQASDVGTYALNVGGVTSGNYAITFEAGALSVVPAALTVRADDVTRSYGAANPRLTATIDGFVLGQDAGDLDGALALETNATQASDVGRYRIVAGGLSSGNYVITYENGAFDVTPAALTVRANDATRTYGAADPRFTARIDGFVLGQDAGDLDGALTLGSTARRDSDVGRYAVVAGGLSSGNYAITYENGAFDVTPAALTIRADDATRTYGGANPRLTATGEGFVLGQDFGDLDGRLRVTTGATRDSDVGRYAVTAGGVTSGNYTITFADGSLAVTPARLVVTPRGDRSYGDPTTDFTTDFDGFVLGQDPGDLDGRLVFDTDARIDSDVGRYDLTAGGLTGRNYEIVYRDGVLRIDPARLTVRADDASRTYGAANPRLGATIDGFVLGQGLDDLNGALVVGTDARTDSDAGRYAVRAGGVESRNYDIRFVDGRLDVTPARLTVTANDASRIEGQPNPPFSARFDGFVLGQDAGDLDGALVFGTDADLASGPGAYAVTPEGLSSGNYRIAYVDGLLTVAPSGVDGGGAGLDALVEGVDPVSRGAPPYTPGDSAFRTTQAEAPTAIANTFQLTYSLGEVTQLVPTGAAAPAPAPTPGAPGLPADAGGFAPASGGFAPASGGAGSATGGFAPAAGGAGGAGGPTPGQAATCSGPVAGPAPGAEAGCAPRTTTESFWSTAFPGAAN